MALPRRQNGDGTHVPGAVRQGFGLGETEASGLIVDVGGQPERGVRLARQKSLQHVGQKLWREKPGQVEHVLQGADVVGRSGSDDKFRSLSLSPGLQKTGAFGGPGPRDQGAYRPNNGHNAIAKGGDGSAVTVLPHKDLGVPSRMIA